MKEIYVIQGRGELRESTKKEGGRGAEVTCVHTRRMYKKEEQGEES